MRGKTNIGGGNIVQGVKKLCTVQDGKQLKKGEFFQYVSKASQENGKQLANGFSNNAELRRYIYDLSDGRFLLIRAVSTSNTYNYSGNTYYIVASILSITDGYINEDYSFRLDNTNIVKTFDGGSFRACKLTTDKFAVAVTCNGTGTDTYKYIVVARLAVNVNNSTITASDGGSISVAGHFDAKNIESFELIPTIASKEQCLAIFYNNSTAIKTLLVSFTDNSATDRTFINFSDVDVSGDGIPATNYYSAPLGTKRAWSAVGLTEGTASSFAPTLKNLKALMVCDYPNKVCQYAGNEYTLKTVNYIEVNNAAVVANQLYKLTDSKALLLQKQRNGKKAFITIILIGTDGTLTANTTEVNLDNIDATCNYFTDSAITLLSDTSGYLALYAFDSSNMVEKLFTLPITINGLAVSLGTAKASMVTEVNNTNAVVMVSAFHVNSNGIGFIAHDYVNGLNQTATTLYALDVEADGLGITGRYSIIKPYEDIINGITNESGASRAIISAYVPESEA